MTTTKPSIGIVLVVGPNREIIASDLVKYALTLCRESISDYKKGTGKNEHVETSKRYLADAVLFAAGFPDDDWLDRPRRHATKSGVGFVYLVKNNKNGRIKIGWSSNPKLREKTLQSEDPDVAMVFSWPGSRIEERSLHDEFAPFRVRGEWFNLTEHQISEIVTGNRDA